MTDAAAGEGLDFHLDIARSGATFDGHRVIHLAGEHGLQDAMKERLLRAYFTEGELIGDPDTLVRLAVEVGLDEDEVRAMLASDRFAEEVRADERTGRRSSGSARCRRSWSTARSARPALTRRRRCWACSSRAGPTARRCRSSPAARAAASTAAEPRGPAPAQRPIISSDTSHSRSRVARVERVPATPPAAGPASRRLRSASASLQSSK